ncbi:hypothetical protein CI109_102841 [Kwoniella shandongensis]|uniref:RING-type domain-containing protein n=1 Tax=Kwoniella shandongensis TaxID=1734106 RepID=A0A5M6C870_9TREE|nr:uncharacterized protein CI109_000031 [Kwoniella shandongensis]KAA5531193.1 hypothetical protein CI109_000031 [Kwoniella shandongensis]
MAARTLSQSGGISGWYTQSYARPFPTNRLRAPSLIPGSRNPLPITVQQTLVVDLAHAHNANGETKDDSANVRRRETIFGPDVGEDDEPGWTDEKKEEVGVDVVKSWVEKAKNEEGLHPTTTLQALVNLKRPTLLLQQLQVEGSSRPSIESESAIGESEITPAAPASSRPDSYIPPLPLHVLKFNYDATTPQVRISLEVYPTPQPPIEGKESIVEDHEPKIIYHGLHPGGFNQVFNLPPNAALDLSNAIIQQSEETNVDLENGGEKARPTDENGAAVPSLPAQDVAEVTAAAAAQEGQSTGRRRFGLFRRNREEDLEAGAQIEMTNAGLNGINGIDGESEKAKEEKKEIEQGMRLLIRIDGVGPEGQALKRRNAQLTHILINGTWVADTANGNQAGGKRVWVIKVARREAVIGAHTFLLKEIYGLSATSTSTAPTAYPPTSDDPYASTPNECIVCLTSPRDVVLLPCRHLVVCRDCAVGMVEFGAGGKVARREDGETGPTTGGAVAGGDGGAAEVGGVPAPAVAGGTTTTGRERRKKKVKGWYCPVCRQPYTSLLRLALPESDKPPANGSGGTRPPSRAASIRTFKSGRAPSIAPTLPDGAERMLESLRPAGVRDGDDDDGSDDEAEVHAHAHAHEHEHREVERPQFVLEDEVEPHTHTNEQVQSSEKDQEVEHQEDVTTTTTGDIGEDGKPKGWKEVP